MKNSTESKLTSVKIVKKNYSNFKKITSDSDFTFQKFVNRALDLYLSNSEIFNKINNHETCGIKNSKF
jgi:hypothetical protein